MAENPTQQELEGAEFRKKRQWVSFKAQIYSALSNATFVGVLMGGVGLLIAAASPGEAAQTALETLKSPLALSVMGGALAIGASLMYMGGHEWTELKMLEDDHLARRNAQCLQQEREIAKEVAKEQVVEYEQNKRPDGQQWAQVVDAQKEPARQVQI